LYTYKQEGGRVGRKKRANLSNEILQGIDINWKWGEFLASTPNRPRPFWGLSLFIGPRRGELFGSGTIGETWVLSLRKRKRIL